MLLTLLTLVLSTPITSSPLHSYQNTPVEEVISTSPGKITYSWLTGQLQCRSEIDQNGHITALIEPADKHTTILHTTLTTKKEISGSTQYLVTVYFSEGAYSAQSARSVTLLLDPLPVETISLKGNVMLKEESVPLCILYPNSYE